MKDLQLVLFVIGAIVIVAVLLHGFWSIRKQPKPIKNKNAITGFYKDQASRQPENDIGPVKVVKKSEADPSVKLNTNRTSPQSAVPKREPTIQRTPTDNTAKMTARRQEPTMSIDIDDTDAPLEIKLNTTQQNNAEAESSVTAPEAAPKVAPQPEKVEQKPEKKPLGEVQDVLVLHVASDEQFMGRDLLPALLSLNLTFGDKNIFHRYDDNDNSLFSVANMVKPGIFELEHMEQFSTPGIALFMSLPCHGDPIRNFSIMLNSATQLADELNGNLLDAQRKPWNDTIKQDYLARIYAVDC